MTALFPEMGQRPKIISPQRSNSEPPANGPTAEEQGATARAIIMRVQFCHPGESARAAFVPQARQERTNISCVKNCKRTSLDYIDPNKTALG